MDIADIEQRIMSVRGYRVMLDSDLAKVFGVTTRRLNEQVRRNIGRFPEGFMFRLTSEEQEVMRSQIATASRRNARFPPFAFTEHGTIMLASVLNSPTAIATSVLVVRAFVRLRDAVSAHKELSAQLDKLERRVAGHDEALKEVFRTIRQLMAPSNDPPRKIGFRP